MLLLSESNLLSKGETKTMIDKPEGGNVRDSIGKLSSFKIAATKVISMTGEGEGEGDGDGEGTRLPHCV